MRELKFRAWTGINYLHSDKYWLGNDSETLGDVLNGKFTNYVWQQYTGLKDKNGVEIYEGDIVEGGFEKHRGVVTFGLYANPFGSDEWTGYQGFYIKWSKEHAEMTRGDMGYWINRGMETAVEAIGNIYENPDLLEAQT